MKPRLVYLLLFAVPGLVLSALLTMVLIVGTVAVLWIFVLGDNPWPGYVSTLLVVGFGLLFLAMWVATMVAGYRLGAARHADGAINPTHIVISAAATLLLVLLFVVGFGYQAVRQRFTPPSEGARCSEFCSARGYNASSVSPQIAASRTCSCLDSSGAAVLQVPLEAVK